MKKVLFAALCFATLACSVESKPTPPIREPMPTKSLTANEALFAAALDDIDSEIRRDKTDRAISRARNVCLVAQAQDPRGHVWLVEQTRLRFDSPTYPIESTLAEQILDAIFTYICPEAKI